MKQERETNFEQIDLTNDICIYCEFFFGRIPTTSVQNNLDMTKEKE